MDLTARLDYRDAYLTGFSAQVIEIADQGRRVYLDQTAFYPTSGGQLHDLGLLEGVPVTDVIDEEGRIAHILAEPLPPGPVTGEIDWARRFDHMQQHSGQHLLSAVLDELFGAATVSVHMGAAISTVDIAVATLSEEQLHTAEARANAVVAENRPVTVTFEDAQTASGLRKATERTGVIRIVSIDGLDRSACGGTHVRQTGEIGAILLRKADKMRGNVRLEFLCGLRAIRRARADFDALAQAARTFSAPLDDVPALVAAQTESLRDAEKQLRKLNLEVAEVRGRELYAQAEAVDGLRRHLSEGSITDTTRAVANSFVSQGRSLFLALSAAPPAVLLAASADSGVHCGNVLKPLLAQHGGRGGGSATQAQGSLPSPAALAPMAAALGFRPSGSLGEAQAAATGATHRSE